MKKCQEGLSSGLSGLCGTYDQSMRPISNQTSPVMGRGQDQQPARLNVLLWHAKEKERSLTDITDIILNSIKVNVKHQQCQSKQKWVSYGEEILLCLSLKTGQRTLIKNEHRGKKKSADLWGRVKSIRLSKKHHRENSLEPIHSGIATQTQMLKGRDYVVTLAAAQIKCWAQGLHFIISTLSNTIIPTIHLCFSTYERQKNTLPHSERCMAFPW